MNVNDFKNKYFKNFKFESINDDDSNVENWIIGLEDEEERYLFFTSSNEYFDSEYLRDKRNYRSGRYGCFLKTDNHNDIKKIYFYRIVTDDVLFKTKIDKIAVEPTDDTFIKKLNKLSFSEDGNFEEFDNLFDRTHLVNEFKLLYRRTKDYLLGSNLINGITNGDDKKQYVDLILTRFLFLWFLQKKDGKLLDNNDNYLIEKFKEHKNNFYNNFLQDFFFTSLCYSDSNQAKIKLSSKIGRVPYLNSGLFLKSKIEESYLIEIEDKAFYINEETTYGLKNTKTYSGEYPIFNVFDSRDWTNLSDKVLGDIFEELMNTDERKGTGAFYTPSVITKYMSKNTIEPYLLNILEENKYEYASLEDLFNNCKDKEAFNVLFKNLNKITIVDNACGSGHYLADASEYLVSIWDKLRENKFNEQIKAIDREGNIINKKICDCSSKDFAYHIIVNNIYGVDLNDEAVAIAKLRLFLFMADKFDSIEDVIPLPNISFNVECGNSLIGFTEIKNISNFRNSKFDSFAVNNIINKYSLLTKIDYLNENLEKLKYYEKTIDNPKNWFEIRNNLINYFKNLHNPEIAILLRDLIVELTDFFNRILNEMFFNEYLLDKTKINNLTEKPELLKQFEDKNPFHWTMRFSDVFENDGFDIVIGNPPYVRQELIKDDKPYLEKIFKEIYDGIADLSTYFIYRSIQILKEEGIHSYIITNKWMRANYGLNIRKYLKENSKILELIDFNGVKVFVGATVDVLVYFVIKNKELNPSIKTCNSFDNLKTIYNINDVNKLSKIITKNTFSMKQNDLGENSWNLINSKLLEIYDIIENKGIKLKNWNTKINFGIKTGFNEAFIIDRNTQLKLIPDNKEIKIINPIMKGKDIRKYFFSKSELYIISTFPSLKLDINNYPLVKEHLLKYGKRLEQTGESGSRKKTSHKWFETQDNIAYYEDFEKPKIIFSRIVKKPQFFLDVNGFYSEATSYIISGENLKYLLVLLNSNFVYNSFYKFYSGGGVDGEIKIVKLVEYPFVKIDNIKPFEIIADYLLFSNQWLHENLNSKSKEYYKVREISQFFDEVANALVYELYLKEELQKDNLYFDLLKEVELRLKDIDFDNWSKELFKDKEEKDITKLKEIENNNINTLINVYENLDVKNILADIQEMKTNEYIKIIEESGK